MSSTFSPNIHLEEPGLGDYNNSWNTPVNSNFSLIDQKFGTFSNLVVGTSNFTLTNITAAFWGFVVTGALTGDQVLTFPTIAGTWIVTNSTTGAHNLIVKGSSGDTGTVVPQGQTQTIYTNGGFSLPFLTPALVKAGLGYTPANQAGDTFSGFAVFSVGLGVTTVGISISAGNLGLTSGNIIVSNGTLSVAGGLATLSNGLSVNGGTTIANGVTVSSGTAAFGTTTATTVTLTDNSTNVATTAFVTGAVPLLIAGQSYGGVGTYICGSVGGDLAPGATTAGSGITVESSGSGSSSNPSGTWRYMGGTGTTGGRIFLRTV